MSEIGCCMNLLLLKEDGDGDVDDDDDDVDDNVLLLDEKELVS